MEYTTEIINISKIKEGFYIGDRIAGTNLEVIMHFKITHIINAAASQIINTFESIGIKYLSLHWSENLNQKLFNAKDEVVDRITAFIDDSLKNGEGLLVHSLRGQKRVCIVVIIYLIKKFRWGIMKCIDFLYSKKTDFIIPNSYLIQLGQFEARLMKLNQDSYTYDWLNDQINDREEMLLRNTYVNGLPLTTPKKINQQTTNINGTKPKITWADCNPYNKKDTLVHQSAVKDLMLQKKILPVTSHMKLKPGKSCIKLAPSSDEDKKNIDQSNNIENNNEEIKNDDGNTINNIGKFNRTYQCDRIADKEQDFGLPPRMTINELNSQSVQSLNMHNNYISRDPDFLPGSDDRKDNMSYTTQNMSVISPFRTDNNNKNIERTNNFNKNKLNIKKGKRDANVGKRPSTVDNNDSRNNQYLGKKMLKKNNYMKEGEFRGYIVRNGNRSVQQLNNSKKFQKHYGIELGKRPPNNYLGNNKRVADQLNIDKIRSAESKRIIINNYFKEFALKKNNSNDAILPFQGNYISNTKEFLPNMSGNEYNIMSNYQHKKVPFRGNGNGNGNMNVNMNMNGNSHYNYVLPGNRPLNNFDLSLMKNNQSNMYLRSNITSEKGPIKLSKEYSCKKPLTPDQAQYINSKLIDNNNKGYIESKYNDMYGTLIRNSSKNSVNANANYNEGKIIRPSTAPQRDKDQRNVMNKQAKSTDNANHSNTTYINPLYPGMKRVSSPMIQSHNLIHSHSTGSAYIKAPPLILKPSIVSIDSYKRNPLINK